MGECPSCLEKKRYSCGRGNSEALLADIEQTSTPAIHEPDLRTKDAGTVDIQCWTQTIYWPQVGIAVRSELDVTSKDRTIS